MSDLYIDHRSRARTMSEIPSPGDRSRRRARGRAGVAWLGSALALAGSLTLVSSARADDGPGRALTGASAQDTAPGRLTSELLSEFRYRFIGPANPSGRITTLAVPDEPRRRLIFAGMASGGVWNSTNGGLFRSPGRGSSADPPPGRSYARFEPASTR